MGYQSVADSIELKRKDVKAVVEGYMAVCAEELKKTGSFKFGQMIKLKLKKKPATPARKGVNPFTKEPCVFKAKPLPRPSKAWRCASSRTLSIESHNAGFDCPGCKLPRAVVGGLAGLLCCTCS